MAAPKYKVTVGGETFSVGISRERLRQLRRNAEGKCSVAKCRGKVFRAGRCKKDYERDVAARLARYHKTTGE